MSVLVNPWPISVAIETCLSPSKGDCGRVTIKKKWYTWEILRW